jgi:LuxR family transcriptional regulator, maltose regulon positive regulatory protein
MLPQFFLKTKLLPPRLGRRVLPRSRLIERLRGFLDQPATIVCADAGCGKTTLVTDFVRSSGHPFVWYQIDRSDVDLAVFFGYLVYGIRSHHPDFGDVVLRFLSEAENLGSNNERLIDVFVNEITEHVDEKIIVVLDDYHHVDASEHVGAAVDRLIQYAPDVLHVVITTRVMPNLSITRLRSKGLIGTLGRQDLCFTRDEVRRLFEHNSRGQLGVDFISRLYERTNGWATGLQLILQAFEHLAENNHFLGESWFVEVLKRSDGEIFDYFAEEVLQFEPPETQEALLRLSLFGRIDPAAAGCVLPVERAYHLLALLQRSNLFISQVEGGDADEYQLHPMFRKFLRRRLKDRIGWDALRDLQSRYADQLLSLGNWQTAGLMYSEARNTGSVARILVEHGREMLDAGMFEIAKRGYDLVVESIPNVHPEIPRVRAHVARIEGDLELADRLFKKSVKSAAAIGDSRCEASSLHGLASVHVQRGEHARAFVLAREALDKSPEDDLALRAQCEHTIGNCQFLASVATGQFDEAITTWHRATKLAQLAGKESLAHTISHNIGMPFAFSGDFVKAREWFSRLVDAPSEVVLPQHALAYCNLARADFALGAFERCDQMLEKAFEVCRLFNLTLERAEAHQIAGNLHREREAFNLAREHYLQAENLCRDAAVNYESSELPEEWIRLFLAEGNPSKARTAAKELVEKRERLGHALSLARARMLLGQVLLDEQASEAIPLFTSALERFEECRASFWIAKVRFFLARAELAASHEEEAKDHLTEALRISRQMSFTSVSKAEAGTPDLFRLAVTNGIELGYLNSIGLNATASDAVKVDDGSRVPKRNGSSKAPNVGQEVDLTINLLGPIEILREQNRKLSPDAWTLSRALKILCYISSRQNHRATKDALVETFWPDTRLEDIDKNFWPTISYIRRALNSNQPIKKNFIRYRESAYYFNPEFTYLIDAEEFERLIVLARDCRRQGDNAGYASAANKALQLYRGDFLEEIYDRWVEEPRAYYQGLYFTTLKELADHHHRAREYDLAITYCKMILNRDAYREDVHRQLMDSQARVGNQAAVHEQYESLKSLLKEELGVDPLPETVATYRRLVSGS